MNQHQQMPGGCDPDQHTMLPLDSIICGDNVDVLRSFPDDCVDLTVTSPPYDKLRAYNGYSFDFERVAQELYRVTKQGGVVVWVVGDAHVKWSETGTSFRQALRFVDAGFNLHDTMIYAKSSPPIIPTVMRYQPEFEFMFVLSKGKPSTFNALTESKRYMDNRRNKAFHRKNNGAFVESGSNPQRTDKVRTNIWRYAVGGGHSTSDKCAHAHPAIFPEALAADHILSWSNEGQVVLDPFSGSGTTAKMAAAHGRRFIGIDVSEEYCEIARKRLENVTLRTTEVKAPRPLPPKKTETAPPATPEQVRFSFEGTVNP